MPKYSVVYRLVRVRCCQSYTTLLIPPPTLPPDVSPLMAVGLLILAWELVDLIRNCAGFFLVKIIASGMQQLVYRFDNDL